MFCHRKINRTTDLPYIKKPMNAFMIFRKVQRKKVMEDLKIRDSAAVNAVLGKMRRSLSKEEQDGYYEKAKVEKELHSQQHPGWSATFNYEHRLYHVGYLNGEPVYGMFPNMYGAAGPAPQSA
ncbi:transcription factor 7-like [Nelusetta ayraudi]|uniref:transcription factor 7-like n=1 Tax=Nelusetta ayraudi TaxID=303726 RepID=UPI003F6F52FA